MAQVSPQAERHWMSIAMTRGSRGRGHSSGGGLQGTGTVVFLEELCCVFQHLVVLAQLQLALAVVEHQRCHQALQLQPAILPWLLLSREPQSVVHGCDPST